MLGTIPALAQPTTLYLMVTGYVLVSCLASNVTNLPMYASIFYVAHKSFDSTHSLALGGIINVRKPRLFSEMFCRRGLTAIYKRCAVLVLATASLLMSVPLRLEAWSPERTATPSKYVSEIGEIHSSSVILYMQNS